MEKKAMAKVIINLGSSTCRMEGNAVRRQAGRAGSETAGTTVPTAGSRLRPLAGAGQDLLQQICRGLRAPTARYSIQALP